MHGRPLGCGTATAGGIASKSWSSLKMMVDHDLQVISIWGSNIGEGSGGDPGTASVFRRVYRDPRTCEKFKIRA